MIPTGVVTFLFTDIEGSTRLWAMGRSEMAASLEVHDRLLHDVMDAHSGHVFTTAGDSFAVAFSRASDAVEAARTAQGLLDSSDWPGPALGVRMALHLGETAERDGDYFGPAVNLAARLCAAAHGGQIVMTDIVRQATDAPVRELGVHRLRDIDESLHVWQLGEADHPPLRAIDSERDNLPLPSTMLIGRTEEVEEVRAALQTARLVTLTAVGGAGKTRLALSVAELEVTARPEGVWFVDLTETADGSLVAPAIASALGLRLIAGDVMEQVLGYVAGKNLLLVLDNCEHVIDACADFAERFVGQPGPNALLATSRERLEVAGERVIAVPPLSSNDTDSASVELFERRAADLDSSFVLSAADRRAVAELCQRLDGLPLAIELAAARSTVMSPAELLAGLGDRFRLLDGGRRRGAGALEAALDWSYELLDQDEQWVFRSLGAFAGTFDLDAVASVASVDQLDALDLIESLVAKSLVAHHRDDGRSRFRLLETTAAYARQRLSEEESTVVRDRHLDHYLSLALRHPLALWSDLAAWPMFRSDKANLVAAIDWANRGQRSADAGRLLLAAFTVFYEHPTEGIELVDQCVGQLDADQHDLAMRLVCNQWFLYAIIMEPTALMAVERVLRASPLDLFQVVGGCLLAYHAAVIDPARGDRILEATKVTLRGLPNGTDRVQAEVAFELASCMVALHAHRPEQARRHAQATVATQEALGFSNEASAYGAAMEALASLQVGEPSAAFDAAVHYGRSASALGTGDEVRALAHIALDDLEAASAAARDHAKVALTGRVALQAADSLLLLAALCRAEGDLERARAFLVGMGMCRHIELVVYAQQLADQLGVLVQFNQGQIDLRSDLGATLKRRAVSDLETLRVEVARRGWE